MNRAASRWSLIGDLPRQIEFLLVRVLLVCHGACCQRNPRDGEISQRTSAYEERRKRRVNTFILHQHSFLSSLLAFSFLSSLLAFSFLSSLLAFSFLGSLLAFSSLSSLLAFSFLGSLLAFSFLSSLLAFSFLGSLLAFRDDALMIHSFLLSGR